MQSAWWCYFLPHYGHNVTFTSLLAQHDLSFRKKKGQTQTLNQPNHKKWYVCKQFPSVLVISAFVSFSVTRTILDYVTMSWWLKKWRTWRIKSSRNRMLLSANWNRRTLKWLYVVTVTHISIVSFSYILSYSRLSLLLNRELNMLKRCSSVSVHLRRYLQSTNTC